MNDKTMIWITNQKVAFQVINIIKNVVVKTLTTQPFALFNFLLIECHRLIFNNHIFYENNFYRKW